LRPPTSPPSRTGFGTRLIERGLAGGLKAQVKLDYRPEGLVFTLVAPVGETITEG
jgi:two-component sensor histidine kinase